MTDTKRKLDRARRAAFFASLKRSGLTAVFVALVIAVLVFSVWKSGDSAIASELDEGRLVGIHQNQANLGSLTRVLSIEISHDNVVVVDAPDGLPVKLGARVEVRRIESEQGGPHYAFNRYLE